MRGALLVAVILAVAARPGRACEWDSETYYAEAHSLPCVYDAIFGHYGRHTNEYYETRIAAADAALAWAPFDVAALDDKAVALLKLGRFDESRTVMRQRAEVDPDAYGTHANLGTLETFTGEYAEALAHIDRALALEPRAHFGRERYHRQLVVFLQAGGKDPARLAGADFLGLELTETQRFSGSPVAFAAAGLTPDSFDAVVSMIAVYGADRMSHLYFALGDLLALHGDLRLAWSAYKRASELDHPRKAEIKRWLPRLLGEIAGQPSRRNAATLGRASGRGDVLLPEDGMGIPIYKFGGYLGIDAIYKTGRNLAGEYVDAYQSWERRQLRRGLPVWRAAGMEAVYARQNLSRKRCRAPGVIEQRPADDVSGPPPAPPATGAGPPEPAASAYVAALETAAQVRGDCAARAGALAQVRTAEATALAAARPPLFRAIARDGTLHARMNAALGAITDAEMACRAGAAGKPPVRRPPDRIGRARGPRAIIGS